MDADSMDAVFHALSHAVRRRILDILKDRDGASVAEVCDHFEMSRIGVMKHLHVLEVASLVTSVKEGRTRHLYFNAVPIQMIHDRWTSEYSALWAARLTRLKYTVESKRRRKSKARKK
jgi:DNA-binding transcriptional ArsR family regulator